MMGLPLHHAPSVSPHAPDYRDGFRAGFVAPRDTGPPSGQSLAYRVGWNEGQNHYMVPAWRWNLHPVSA